MIGSWGFSKKRGVKNCAFIEESLGIDISSSDWIMVERSQESGLSRTEEERDYAVWLEGHVLYQRFDLNFGTFQITTAFIVHVKMTEENEDTMPLQGYKYAWSPFMAADINIKGFLDKVGTPHQRDRATEYSWSSIVQTFHGWKWWNKAGARLEFLKKPIFSKLF